MTKWWTVVSSPDKLCNITLHSTLKLQDIITALRFRIIQSNGRGCFYCCDQRSCPWFGARSHRTSRVVTRCNVVSGLLRGKLGLIRWTSDWVLQDDSQWPSSISNLRWEAWTHWSIFCSTLSPRLCCPLGLRELAVLLVSWRKASWLWPCLLQVAPTMFQWISEST